MLKNDRKYEKVWWKYKINVVSIFIAWVRLELKENVTPLYWGLGGLDTHIVHLPMFKSVDSGEWFPIFTL